jgi:hypothetical protein
LKSIQEKWSGIHIIHPSRVVGVNIIDELLAKRNIQQRYVKPHSYLFKSTPTSVDLMNDLGDNDTFYHAITLRLRETANTKQFLDGWMNMGDSGDPLQYPPYIAMNVQCKSENGLQKCMRDLPDTLQTDDVFVSRTDDGSSCSLTNVLMPAFTIAQPHMTPCSRGQVYLVAYGYNVVVWWDDSEELRETFGGIYASRKGDYTWTAVKTWPGLRWSILHPGEYIEMLPGTVHASITPVNSAICGWYFMKKQWLSGGIFRKLLTWELDLIKNRMKVFSSIEEDPKVLLKTIEGDLKHWQVWLQGGNLEQQVKSELRTLKKEIENIIRGIRKDNKES